MTISHVQSYKNYYQKYNKHAIYKVYFNVKMNNPHAFNLFKRFKLQNKINKNKIFFKNKN